MSARSLPAKEAADRVCHDEQMTVWTGEIAGALNLAGFLRDDLDYDDVIQLHGVLARGIRSIVECAFDHPELKLVQSTTLDETP